MHASICPTRAAIERFGLPGDIPVTVVDLSEGGLRAVTAAPLPLEAEMQIHLVVDYPHGGSTYIEARGIVRRSFETPNGRAAEAGIEFLAMTENDLEVIRKYVLRRSSYG